jgi:predicted phage tail protein
MAPPGAFNKSLPANGAINQPVNLSLSWAASTGAVSYWYCYDKTNDNACSTWVNNGSQTSVGLSNLAPNTKYYWQVRAVNGAGTTYANGTAASFWSLTTGTLPGSFLRTSPANGASNRPLSPTLKWADSTSANSYEYCFDTTNDNTCTTWLNNGTATSKTLSGLTVNTTYYWQVRAVNAVGTTYSGASSTDYWSFRVEAPAAFNKTGPANGATGQPLSLTLEWAASNGAGSYWYCIDTTNDNACSTTWIKNSTFTSILLNNLLPNTTYYWHVRAVNTAGTIFSNGSNNAFWSFITGP